ncbi:MAG: Metalloprotease MmpA [Deltaproteobacteria bacterium ADurb.Bin510]|nr:MAG: Metalloprotease MmpA [Deltaproteobacteria bacterium ADurb.Bin510]
MITLLAFIIVLGILILIHELGHFILAKAGGVGVIRFSLGFGPTLVKHRLGETEYQIAAVPLGGYVKMVGEDEDDEENAGFDPGFSFAAKPLRIKAMIVAAGPVFNLLLAIAIFASFAWIGIETPAPDPIVGTVQQGSPAESAGILKGDRITSLNGLKVSRWEQISQFVQQADPAKPLVITLERGGQNLKLTARPKTIAEKNMFGEQVRRSVLGIAHSGQTVTERYGFFGGLGYGCQQTWWVIKITGIAVGKMFDGTVAVRDSLGGPIMIADISGQAFKAGAMPFFYTIAIISVSLAILNLLPIPILDGGHLLFFLIEAITGRPVTGRPREIAQQIGLFLLIMLMVLAFYNDIARLLSGHP